MRRRTMTMTMVAVSVAVVLDARATGGVTKPVWTSTIVTKASGT